MWSGADRRGQLGVDQFLHPVLQQPAKQLPAVTLTEPRQQVRNSGIIVMGHRVNTFLSEFFVVLTKGHAMAHPTGGPPALPTPPHGTPTHCSRAVAAGDLSPSFDVNSHARGR